MTPLRQRMIEDMQVRNLTPRTQESYLFQVSRFARHFHRSPALLGPEERQLLGMSAVEGPVAEPCPDYRDRYERLTGCSLWQCPACRQGRMLVVEILAGGHRRPAIADSS